MLGIWVLCQAANLVAAVWMLCAIISGSNRALLIAKSFDQLGNATTGGNEDELISSRAAKARKRGEKWACVLCKILDKIEANHCENSIEYDEGKP
ncbi:hypothetical protein C3Y98_05285 [Methylotenera oryzisoli]|uniref:Uncharacterized protein n=2 Tax=Methylotenera oryzisoli TaxID=2080758 RepID=A0A4Y9VSH6_9PROT|nr:hypothetical protein C3Y98_05285 [Methylotenera oryzisoli]